MQNRKIRELYNCNYIEDNGNLYPLQKWYNQLIDKKVSEISVADVLRMIRQNEFFELAISKAIFFLKKNPFEGELYDGELLEKISNIEIHLMKDFLDDIKIILIQALEKNANYGWLLEEERKEFQGLVVGFSKNIDKFSN